MAHGRGPDCLLRRAPGRGTGRASRTSRLGFAARQLPVPDNRNGRSYCGQRNCGRRLAVSLANRLEHHPGNRRCLALLCFTPVAPCAIGHPAGYVECSFQPLARRSTIGEDREGRTSAPGQPLHPTLTKFLILKGSFIRIEQPRAVHTMRAPNPVCADLQTLTA